MCLRVRNLKAREGMQFTTRQMQKKWMTEEADIKELEECKELESKNKN